MPEAQPRLCRKRSFKAGHEMTALRPKDFPVPSLRCQLVPPPPAAVLEAQSIPPTHLPGLQSPGEGGKLVQELAVLGLLTRSP